jgi:hypothetical protein
MGVDHETRFLRKWNDESAGPQTMRLRERAPLKNGPLSRPAWKELAPGRMTLALPKPAPIRPPRDESPGYQSQAPPDLISRLPLQIAICIRIQTTG